MDSAGLTEKNIRITGTIKLKEQEIFELKKRVAESESRLKQQQSLYEAVRSDRNLYSKNLIESQVKLTIFFNRFAHTTFKFYIAMEQFLLTALSNCLLNYFKNMHCIVGF